MDAFMQPAFESLAAGFPQLIFYLLMVAVIYVLAILIYVRLTPHKGIWTAFSLILQLFLFRMTDYIIFRGMPERIERDEVGPTLVLGAFKLSGSLILAFAIAG